MNFLRRLYLFGFRVGHQGSLVFRLIHHILTNVDDLSFILTEPPRWNVHLLMGCAVLHLKREDFGISDLIGKGGSFLSHERLGHAIPVISQFINFLIGFVLDDS